MNSPSSNLFRAAFIADSLSLGSHWIYNQDKIARLYPDGVTSLDKPHSKYHPERKKGQFTHFGDQMVILAKAVVASPQWSVGVFQSLWQGEMRTFNGYRDGATTTTLENLLAGKEEPASDSDDLAGASRFVPVFFLRDASLEDTVKAAREQTALTHGAGTVIDAAEFFVRAIDALNQGLALPAAFAQATSASYSSLAAQDFLQQAEGALNHENHLQVGADFGLTCHLKEAFPLTLYYALRWYQAGGDLSEQGFLTALSDNALAGGDNAARAIPLAALLAAAGCVIPTALWDELDASEHLSALEKLLITSRIRSEKITFTGANGDSLDARLELPSNQPRGYALFAHCFTCGKASRAATAISRALAEQGIATLRFDFTGLGTSDGDFANTSFISNVQDLVAAADHLREHFAAPQLIIGHSLGGAAVLAAAGEIAETSHVATIGAPYDPGHVTHLFADDVPKILADGKAQVTLAGRPFEIGERFLSDLTGHNQKERIAKLGRKLLIMHSPTDTIVPLENAGQIYSAAHHPKSFLSLDEADHLLTDASQARYAAELISTWVSL